MEPFCGVIFMIDSQEREEIIIIIGTRTSWVEEGNVNRIKDYNKNRKVGLKREA